MPSVGKQEEEDTRGAALTPPPVLALEEPDDLLKVGDNARLVPFPPVEVTQAERDKIILDACAKCTKGGCGVFLPDCFGKDFTVVHFFPDQHIYRRRVGKDQFLCLIMAVPKEFDGAHYEVQVKAWTHWCEAPRHKDDTFQCARFPAPPVKLAPKLFVSSAYGGHVYPEGHAVTSWACGVDSDTGIPSVQFWVNNCVFRMFPEGFSWKSGLVTTLCKTAQTRLTLFHEIFWQRAGRGILSETPGLVGACVLTVSDPDRPIIPFQEGPGRNLRQTGPQVESLAAGQLASAQVFGILKRESGQSKWFGPSSTTDPLLPFEFRDSDYPWENGFFVVCVLNNPQNGFNSNTRLDGSNAFVATLFRTPSGVLLYSARHSSFFRLVSEHAAYPILAELRLPKEVLGYLEPFLMDTVVGPIKRWWLPPSDEGPRLLPNSLMVRAESSRAGDLGAFFVHGREILLRSLVLDETTPYNRALGTVRFGGVLSGFTGLDTQDGDDEPLPLPCVDANNLRWDLDLRGVGCVVKGRHSTLSECTVGKDCLNEDLPFYVVLNEIRHRAITVTASVRDWSPGGALPGEVNEVDWVRQHLYLVDCVVKLQKDLRSLEDMLAGFRSAHADYATVYLTNHVRRIRDALSAYDESDACVVDSACLDQLLREVRAAKQREDEKRASPDTPSPTAPTAAKRARFELSESEAEPDTPLTPSLN